MKYMQAIINELAVLWMYEWKCVSLNRI